MIPEKRTTKTQRHKEQKKILSVLCAFVVFSSLFAGKVSCQIGRAGTDKEPGRAGSDTMRFSGSARIGRCGLQQAGEDTVKAAPQTGASRAPRGPEAVVATANRLVKEGKLENAIKLYRKVLSTEPQIADARLGLGYAFIKMGDYESARREYEEAIAIAPQNSDAYINLGVALYGIGNISEAISQFKKAVDEREGKYPSAHFNLGMAYAHEGDFEKALEHYQTALAQRSNNFPEVNNNLGLVYEAMGNRDRAAEQFRLAIQRQKGRYPLAHYNLARLYHEQAKHAEAIAEFQIAIEQQPQFPEAYLDLGNLYLIRSIANKTDELKQAVDAYKKALAVSGGFYPLAHENLAVALSKQGKKGEALAEYRIAFNQYGGKCPETLQNLMATISSEPSFDIGNELSRPDNVNNLKNKREGGNIVEHISTRLSEYEELDDELKDIPDVRYCAGRAYAAVGNWKAAIAELERAVKLSNNKDQEAIDALNSITKN